MGRLAVGLGHARRGRAIDFPEPRLGIVLQTQELEAKEPGLAGAKHGLKRLGRIEEEVRLPLLPVTPATGEVIRSAMVHAGLLNA